MKERSFIDTNVLVYTDDSANPEKQQVAIRLLESGWSNGNLVMSTQVLQEYFVAATRKLSVKAETAQAKIELLTNQNIVINDVSDIKRAIEIHRLYQYSFWDALIITAALKASCQTLYSEDMHNNQVIENLTIINPFE